MNTIELHAEEVKSPKDAYELFQKKGLERGDQLHIKGDEAMAMVLLTVLIAVVYHLQKREGGSVQFGEKVLNDLFSKSPEELEKEIEAEYGISIEVENEREKEEHPPSYWLDRMAQEGDLAEKIPDPLRWQREQREERTPFR